MACPASDATIQRETDAEFLVRIKPELATIEQERESDYARYLFRRKIGYIASAIGTPICGFLDYMLIKMESGSRNHWAGISILFLFGLWHWVSQPRRDYARAYKLDVIPRIAALLGLQYSISGQIPLMEMEPSKILPAHDRYVTEDYFEGIYKGARVRFCEAQFKKEERDKNGTHYVTVFHGLVLMITMPRQKFYGQTLLVKNQGGAIGSWFQEKFTGLQRADMVDPVFEKRYHVYTNDQVEARYLIDPAMIDRMDNLANVYYSTDISMSYYNNQVLALIRCTKNFFEPKPIEIPATDADGLLQIKKELERTVALIDYLEVYTPRADALPAAAPITA